MAMDVIDGAALLTALLAGAACGWLATVTYFERLAGQRRAYERELAETLEINAAWATLRRTRPGDSAGGR